MHCVHVAVTAILLALSGAATAGDEFPEIKPEGACARGFASQFQEGPDFYIWRCTRELPAPNSNSGSGIYFGLHPALSKPDSGVTRIAGVVAGEPVNWAQWPDGTTIRREAVLDYRHSKEHLAIKLHIFVSAHSESELDQIVEALAKARFVERTPNAA